MTPQELLVKWDAASNPDDFEEWEFEDMWDDETCLYLAAAANHAPAMARRLVELKQALGPRLKYTARNGVTMVIKQDEAKILLELLAETSK